MDKRSLGGFTNHRNYSDTTETLKNYCVFIYLPKIGTMSKNPIRFFDSVDECENYISNNSTEGLTYALTKEFYKKLAKMKK